MAKLIYRHPLPQLILKGVIPVVFERTDKLVGRANIQWSKITVGEAFLFLHSRLCYFLYLGLSSG